VLSGCLPRRFDRCLVPALADKEVRMNTSFTPEMDQPAVLEFKSIFYKKIEGFTAVDHAGLSAGFQS
jgi:hypothetical protein